MTIASEISDLKSRVSQAFSACEEMGATIPSNPTTYNLSDTIRTISGGSGQDDVLMTMIGRSTSTLSFKVPSDFTMRSMCFASWGTLTSATVDGFLGGPNNGTALFSNCTNLTYINFPSLTHLSLQIVDNKGLKTIVLPKCDSIYNRALANCSVLESVYVGTSYAQFGSPPFDGTNDTFNLYVPQDRVDYYKSVYPTLADRILPWV